MMDAATIAIAVISLLTGIIGLIVICRKGKNESVMIKNVKFRQFDQPVRGIDYSLYFDGLGADE